MLLDFCLPAPAPALILSGSGDRADGLFGIATAKEYSGVVGILNRKPGGVMVCEATGVLVSPRHVLSYAHGFSQGNRGQNPTNFMIYVEGVMHPVAAITVHPEGLSAKHYADLAVFTLTTPVQRRVRTYRCNDGSVDELKTGRCLLVGMGISGSTVRGMNRELPNGVKRAGAIPVDGDSGGPIFQADPKDGSLVVVGIASGGGGPSNGGIGHHGIFTRVSPFHGWIEEQIRGGLRPR